MKSAIEIPEIDIEIVIIPKKFQTVDMTSDEAANKYLFAMLFYQLSVT